MVDQLANEYALSPVLFLEYPVDSAPPDRYNRWWAAYTSGGSVYLPLVMFDSGNQINNGNVEFYNVYKPMVETALARPAKAAIHSWVLRCGDRLRFFIRVTNHGGAPVGGAGSEAAVHAIVYEDAHVADTNRYVRAAVATSIAQALADGSSAFFTLESPELTGVNWDKLHSVALADYRPAGTTGPYDMLQAALAPRAGILREDFDADGMNEISVRRPGSGVWYTIPSTSPATYTSTPWGLASDISVSGDYDGDGRTDIAVWRPGSGVWYILPSSTPGNYTAREWGVATDIPVPADYDGDGNSDIAVWRPGSGTWFILPSGTPNTFTSVQWGVADDIPVPADYDGDGKCDIAVWRPGTGVWFAIPSSDPQNYTSTQWGLPSDIPAPLDFDGDGKSDIAAWRPADGVWHILSSRAPGAYTAHQWGLPSDIPVPADYDGDGIADIAVWRPSSGMWYIKPSVTPGTFSLTQWGIPTDQPLSPIARILASLH